jgi:hypothetical protein
LLLGSVQPGELLLVDGEPEQVDCFVSKHERLGGVGIAGEVAQHIVQPEIFYKKYREYVIFLDIGSLSTKKKNSLGPAFRIFGMQTVRDRTGDSVQYL